MKKTPKNIPSPYKFPGTPIFRDTTALPFADGGFVNPGGWPPPDNTLGTTILSNTNATELLTKDNEIVKAGGSKKWEFDPATGAYYTVPPLKLPTKSLDREMPAPEIMPSNSKQKANGPTQARFAYRRQSLHEYDKDTKKFSKFSVGMAPLPYAAKYSGLWQVNSYEDVPDSRPNVWLLNGKKYYNQEDAKAAAKQYEELPSYSFADGGPLNDKTNHGKILNSVYASALGNYYPLGGPINTSGPRVDSTLSNSQMKAKMAYEAAVGNKAAQRMLSLDPKTYDFGNGDFGTHYMSSIDNYAVPELQDKGENQLTNVGAFPPPSNEDFKFQTPEEANYFAENYKTVAPMVTNQYKDGGQFQGKYSLPEDSFRQGGKNLHDSIYASSPQQYPGIYNLGGNLDDRQQMYMPLDHVTRNGGSILSMSNTPQMEGEGKDLTYPENSYAYDNGGPLYTYAGRPNAQYQKDARGNWLINTSGGTDFTPIKDPTGKRSAILNKNATIYTNPAKFKREYDPLLDVTAAIGDNTVVRNGAVIDKNLTANTVNQKKLERDIVASKIKSNPMLSKEQKTDTLLDPRKLDDYSYLAYENKPEPLKAAKEYSTYDKIENIVRNPLVAATYAMQPGAFNMPMNYSELERSPDYSDETWNRNAIGQGINAARYFHPVGLAASAADNLIYTGDDTRKAIESGKLEDWKKAGMSGVNTALDLLGSRYIGNSGRLLNAGEQATLNAMNTSNRLGLNPSVNNYLGTRVFPNLSTSGIQSADNLIQANLFPQLNPMSSKYNPLVKNLYNKGVTVGQAQNIKETAESGGGKVFGTFGHDIETNPNIVYKESEKGNIIPFNTATGKSLQDEYVDNIKEYYNSPEFKRIMKEEHPDVDIEQYKKVTLDNLEKELTYNPSEVPAEYAGAYTTKNSSNTAYMPGHSPTFKQIVANANTNDFQYQNNSGISHISDPSATWHELSHQRTNADELLPRDLTRSDLETNANPFAENMEYHGMPTEFEVRLRQLKEDLKSQGINDYFTSPVTEAHINELDAVKLSKEGDILFTEMKNKYRALKESGASKETLDKVKNQYFDDVDKLENKIGTTKTSKDTQELIQRWTPEYLAKKARILPALIPAAGIAGGATLANPWQQKPKGL